MKLRLSPHITAILLALFVTFLWSTSFIIIKWGLNDIPPLVYAGLRYTIASVCLLPFLFTRQNMAVVRGFRRSDWLNLVILGLLFYLFTQGTLFLGLSLLPSVTVSLMLNFTPLIVAILGIILIKEHPGNLQKIGVLLFITGIILYFYPVSLNESQILGLAIMSVGVLANSASAVLGRKVNKSGNFNPVVVTIISMGTGAVMLISVGLVTEGLPVINTKNALFLGWLAVVNTALAFPIWNYILKTLSAMESSIINGTMLIQISVLAWIFLGEEITTKEMIAMFIAIMGAILVQLKLNRRK